MKKFVKLRVQTLWRFALKENKLTLEEMLALKPGMLVACGSLICTVVEQSESLEPYSSNEYIALRSGIHADIGERNMISRFNEVDLFNGLTLEKAKSLKPGDEFYDLQLRELRVVVADKVIHRDNYWLNFIPAVAANEVSNIDINDAECTHLYRHDEMALPYI